MTSSAELRSSYDDYDSDSPSEWRAIGAVDKVDNLMRLSAEAGDAPAPRVLEIGCGAGAVLAELGRRGTAAEGVELSRSGAEVARARGLTVRVLTDGVSTGYPDSSFDLALLTHVVEHLENPRDTLYEAARVARWVAVEVPLEYHWRTPRNYRPNEIGHINVYNIKLIRHLLQSTADPDVEIWGTGSPMREFLHVDDLADACVFLMEHYSDDSHINVGTGVDLSIGDLAEKVRDVVCPSARLRFDSSKPDGTPRKVLDVTKLRDLGWSPTIDLDTGIAATYQWFLDEQAADHELRGIEGVAATASAH